ncbi:hypothetical protein [Alteromonas sp. H39]|uniref:hypothetical protein n=1 Tax=Alteromonas sp. H39 TaxID=3389876 RepID=UPI0039E0EEB2
MSGSGSGGGFGSGGTGGSFDCSTLAFETHINSPLPAEIAKLSVGDILHIDLSNMNGIQVVRVTYQGNVVGGLVDQNIRMKQCLEQGFSFNAIVRSISGAAVKVFVSAQG